MLKLEGTVYVSETVDSLNGAATYLVEGSESSWLLDADELAEVREMTSDGFGKGNPAVAIAALFTWVDGEQPEPDDFDGGYSTEYTPDESDPWTVHYRHYV